jgi:hypothetical protein
MWLELARPVTLIASFLSLLALLRTAFFGPDVEFQDRVYDTCCMFVIAAAFALLSGLTFREARGHASVSRIHETFPVRIFSWTAGILFVLFLVNWYLQAHYVFFYRDVRY